MEAGTSFYHERVAERSVEQERKKCSKIIRKNFQIKMTGAVENKMTSFELGLEGVRFHIYRGSGTMTGSSESQERVKQKSKENLVITSLNE